MSSTIVSEEITVQEQSQDQQPQAPEKRRGFYGFYVACVLFVATLLNAIDSNEFSSSAPVIARELHMGISSIGLLISAFTIFLTISIIPIGLWADRARRSSVIGACLAVWSTATALTSLAGNFFGLFLTRMFTGIGEAGYSPAGASLVGDLYRKEQQPRVMSWLALATVVGTVIGIVLGGVIAGLALGSWRWAFVITGVPGLVLAAVAWRIREPARQRATGAESGRPSLRPGAAVRQRLQLLLRNKPLMCMFVYGILTEFTATALQSYFLVLLQQKDGLGMTSGQAAGYAGIALGPTALVGVLLGGYLTGWLRRRYHTANVMICVVSVLLTAPLNTATLVSLLVTHDRTLFTALLLPSFFVNALHIGPAAAAIIDLSPRGMRASVMATYLFVVRILGTSTAPLLVGTLASAFDPTGTHFLQSIAGHDVLVALLCTCPFAFIGASIIGSIGLRLVRRDPTCVAAI